MANFKRIFFDMWVVLAIHVVFYVHSSLGDDCSITVKCKNNVYRETFSNNVDMNAALNSCKTGISLEMSNCDSYNLESHGITEVSKFYEIYLSNNNLMKIPILSNNTPIEINELIIKDNPIKSISQDDFRNIRSLDSLYLENCAISKIEKNAISNFPNLFVHLRGNPACTCLTYNFAQKNKQNKKIHWDMDVECPLWDDKTCQPQIESLTTTENNTIVCIVDTRTGDADIIWHRINTNDQELLSLSKDYAIIPTTGGDHIKVSTIRIGSTSPCATEYCQIRCTAINTVGSHSLVVGWPPVKDTFFSQKITIFLLFTVGLIAGAILIVARFFYYKHFDIYESTKSDHTFEPSYGDKSTQDQDQQSNGTAITMNTVMNGGGNFLSSTSSQAPVRVLPALMPPPLSSTHEGEGDGERFKASVVKPIYAQIDRSRKNRLQRRFQNRNEQEVPEVPPSSQSSSASSSLTRSHSKDQRHHGQTLLVTAEVHSNKSYKMAINPNEGGTARYGNSTQENNDPPQSQQPQQSMGTLDFPKDEANDVNQYSVGYIINKLNGTASFNA